MTRQSTEQWSYCGDPLVPDFDDARPLFVFDGHCGLCSGGVRWLMRSDRRGIVQFTSAQGELGAALYRHYGMEMDDTYLLIEGGHAWGMSGGYLRLMPVIGGFWRLYGLVRFVPESWRDAAYRVIARNRYRWFGRHGHCALLTEDQRRRLI